MPATPASPGMTRAVEQAGPRMLDRPAFEQQLVQAWERAVRETGPLSLLRIEIDHFQEYVRSAGLARSTESLERIAAALARAVFRPTDSVARLGETAYAILLPAVHANGARVVASRASGLVNALALPYPAGEGGIVTVSIGVASCAAGECGNVQELEAHCAEALTQAQRMGRDHIVSQDWMA